MEEQSFIVTIYTNEDKEEHLKEILRTDMQLHNIRGFKVEKTKTIKNDLEEIQDKITDIINYI